MEREREREKEAKQIRERYTEYYHTRSIKIYAYNVYDEYDKIYIHTSNSFLYFLCMMYVYLYRVLFTFISCIIHSYASSFYLFAIWFT